MRSGARAEDMVNICEPLINVVTSDKPKRLTGLNQKVDYSFKRALIESVHSGSDYFVSEGSLIQTIIQVQPGITKTAIEDQRSFEGWKHENNI